MMYASTILADNPTCYNRCNEPSGNILLDLTGHGLNATIQGTYTRLQPGAFSSSVSTYFASSTIIQMSFALNISSWTAITIEFWTNANGPWQYIVATYDGTTTKIYVNAVVTSPSAPAAIEISQIFDWFGSYQACCLSEIAIYNYALTPAQISAHAFAANFGFNAASFKQQLVKVFDPNMHYLGLWSDAPLLAGFTETLDAGIQPLQVVLPRNFNFGSSNLQIGNRVQYWLFGPNLPASGLLRYQGVIDRIDGEVKDQDGGNDITATITPFSASLGDRGTVTNVAFGTAGNSSTYVDPVSMFEYFFNTTDPTTGQTYTYPMTLNPSSLTSSTSLGGVKTQFTFQAQDLLSTFQTILLMLPANWFFRCNPDGSVLLNVLPTTAQHTLIVGQHIDNPQYSQDATGLRNDAFVAGATVSGSLVSGRRTGADLSTFGQRLIFHADSRITDAFTASTIAQGLLNVYDRVLIRSQLRLVDFRGDNTGMGVDIESFKVGDTVEIFDGTTNITPTLWGSAEWDASDARWDSATNVALNNVTQIVQIKYGWDYIDVVLGSLQPSQDTALYNIQRKFQDYTLGNQ